MACSVLSGRTLGTAALRFCQIFFAGNALYDVISQKKKLSHTRTLLVWRLQQQAHPLRLYRGGAVRHSEESSILRQKRIAGFLLFCLCNLLVTCTLGRGV
eukprot:TRINITY_DN35884_c0_g1_i1.p3 TRINITY_DN35884_c0_g1~~TRINITY_DN35884_c0_g1_i1.p3  ORF type:complete len:100 (-),score=0.17 TRINITY_DN35884_c0_g1_i1:12-311(-)